MQPRDLSRHYDLAIAYGLVLAWSALAPANRGHWAAEHIMVAGLVGALWLGRATLRFSRLSAWMVFAFLCLHELGAHYTYAEVPYEAWLQAIAGTTLETAFGVERNHYDRLVHLAFGVLLAWPIREALVQLTLLEGRWSYLLTVAVVMAAAMAYEVAEWLAVVAVAPADGGAALLGMQGDAWDSQKDMALAAAGAMAALSLAVCWRDHASVAARDNGRVLHAHGPEQELASVELQHLAGAARLGTAEAVHDRGAGLGHQVGPGVPVGRARGGLDVAGRDMPTVDRPAAAGRDQHRPERRPRRRTRLADEGPVGLVGGGDRLLGELGVGIELAALPGADHEVPVDRADPVRDARHRPLRRIAASAGAAGEEHDLEDEKAASRPSHHRNCPAG